MLYIIKGVAGRLLVKAVDCGSKGPGRVPVPLGAEISLVGALSPTSKIE